MFDNKDVSGELAASMQGNLVSRGIEKQAEQMNKFAKALDYLNSVAEIFDELGLRKEAEATTTLLEVIAKKKNKKSKPTKTKTKSKKSKPSKRSDPATKDLTSEKMEDNLKEKGWVFNADDAHHDSCMCMDCMDADDMFTFDENNAEYEQDEKEQDLARMFHDIEDEDEARNEFEDDFDWKGMRPESRDTMTETPAAKREFDWEQFRPENRPTLPSTPVAKHHGDRGPRFRF